MNRKAAALFAGVFLSLFSLSAVCSFVSAQETKKPVVVDKSKELNEALSRISRLEAQIVEMQSVIGALQTLVQKQGKRLPPQGTIIQNQVETPQYRSQGWVPDARRSLEKRRPDATDRAMKAGPGGDIGADLALDGGPPPRSQVKLNGQNPRSIYDAGYNYMMASDYVSAEATFKAFLANYPQDELSGNAQYWLGESYFVRGDFRRAANEFLKGYKTYRTSQKAPDNLLRLGMSLHRLGQSAAACQTYSELKVKYKSLPGHLSRKIASEMGKAGC